MTEIYAERAVSDRQPAYRCRYPWFCPVQCGGNGIVFRQTGESYRTAYFEAFPIQPPTFLRGEGETVTLAEEQAWQQWQRILTCPRHEFERRGHTSGAGFCIHCQLFALDVFPPAYTCSICQRATDYTSDVNGLYYCREHQAKKMPFIWTPADWENAYLLNALADQPGMAEMLCREGLPSAFSA